MASLLWVAPRGLDVGEQPSVRRMLNVAQLLVASTACAEVLRMPTIAIGSDLRTPVTPPPAAMKDAQAMNNAQIGTVTR